MPHAVVGLGLGVLAAGAITAIITKEIIDNWDEITDRYEDFADQMENDHNVHLPRFRDRYPRQARSSYGAYSRSARFTNSTTASSFSAPAAASASQVYATGREYHHGLTSRSERFTDSAEFVTYDRIPTPDHAHQSYHDSDNEDAEFEAAIAASLREATDILELEDYDTPDYPKAPSAAHLDVTTPRSPDQPQPTLPELGSEIRASEDDENWSERWTNSEGSLHSDHQIDQDWTGSDFSLSDHNDDQTQGAPFGS